MKKYFAILFFFVCIINLNAQTIVNDPDLELDTVLFVQNGAVKLALNPVDSAIYYCTISGDVYKVLPQGSIPGDSLVATEIIHAINHLTGIAFYDSTMYLSGTREIPNLPGYGIIIRGTLQSNNTLAWDTLMITANYQNLGGTFDHSFGGLCLTLDGDSIFIASGSRTDHGEVQSAGGMFPDTREVPLTSMILKLPVDTSGILILNDSAWIDASGFLFCRGVRNTFDIAYSPDGDLFGTENSGDRDDPDELNWLVEGGNYGFPWMMGINQTGQQFPGYDYTLDLLLNPNVNSVTLGLFHDDPSYPAIPGGTVFIDPVKNYGPAADIFRDAVTGFPIIASQNLTFNSTFTPHRAPLGLVFDQAGALGGLYNKKGFVLSYTEGTMDSSSFVPGFGLGPFLDLSEDLLVLDMIKDISGNYFMTSTSLVEQLVNPVDAVLVGRTLYILEINFGAAPPRLLALEFPGITSIAENQNINNLQLYPNPAKDFINLKFKNGKNEQCNIAVYDINGKLVQQSELISGAGDNFHSVNIKNLDAGIYFLKIQTLENIYSGKLIKY